MQVLTGDASVELEGEGVLPYRAERSDAHVAESGGRRQLVSGRGAGCGDWLQHTTTIAARLYGACLRHKMSIKPYVKGKIS